MTNLHFTFSGLSLGIQSSASKSRQNRFATKITFESVLNNLIDLQMFSNRLYIEEDNDLFSLCIRDGTLKIGEQACSQSHRTNLI